MQLRGLVKFFTVALILISLYQLSFTFIVRNVEKKAQVRAENLAKQENPEAKGNELEKLTDRYYDRITDSLQGETVLNILGKKYTYVDAKGQELNLGLDLQGGMNVTLEVSLDEMVRSMSNNPKDAALNKAIEDANLAKANSQANFVTLFGETFKKNNPNRSLASLFTKPSQDAITLQSTDDEVLKVINDEAKDAVGRTYRVIQTRIDKFGVAQPNVNLDENKGIITVELAGVRNPDRVRTYLQSTAKLEFYEMFTIGQAYEALVPAEEALANKLTGDKKLTDSSAAPLANVDAENPDAATTTTTDSAKNGGLEDLLGGTTTEDGTKVANNDTSSAADSLLREQQLAQYPIRSMIYVPEVMQQNANAASLGLVRKQDTAKVNEYLRMDIVKNKLPSNMKFVYGAQKADEKHDPNAPLILYALKTMPDGSAPLEGDHITSSRADFDALTGEPEVLMSMDKVGSNIWQRMTRENKGFQLAVVLDDVVYSAPFSNGEIAGGNTSISGSFSAQETKDLSNILKSGKLPAPAQIVQEQVVGPTLGAESIEAGKNSLIVSFVVIFLLMLVYYNTAGIVANIALILNLLFTFGILAALGATLTMPGIAGLVLTVGMAVDTNVIIFERIKEELSLGKSYPQAVADGYKRSYAPVLDGHITTLITAVILFIFGLGPVLGFATTQIIGLLLSMFCGILVSRLVTDIWTKRERHFKYFTGLSKSIFKKAHFDFIAKRKITYGISVLVLIAGIASVINGFDYGVEFQGGRSFTVMFEQPHTTQEVRESLQPIFGEYPVVKTIGDEKQLNITTAYLIDKPGKEVEAEVRQKLLEGLKAGNYIASSVTLTDFEENYIKSSQTVLPTISDDLVKGAQWATALSLIAIALYILMRFRRWQYSLGTLVALFHDVCVTLAIFSFLRGVVPFSLEIDQHFIAAILTVIGFSMNDTVIVFDRIREYFRKSPNEDKKSVINRAINDTLSRTIMTALTVFLTILILFIFGGEVTRGFAFAMLIGVVTGTYSSIFVAAPVLVDLDKSDNLKKEVDREAQIEELKKLS